MSSRGSRVEPKQESDDMKINDKLIRRDGTEVTEYVKTYYSYKSRITLVRSKILHENFEAKQVEFSTDPIQLNSTNSNRFNSIQSNSIFSLLPACPPFIFLQLVARTHVFQVGATGRKPQRIDGDKKRPDGASPMSLSPYLHTQHKT